MFRVWHDLFRAWHDYFRVRHDYFRIFILGNRAKIGTIIVYGQRYIRTVYKNGDKRSKSVFVIKTVTFVKITVTFVNKTVTIVKITVTFVKITVTNFL